MWGKQPRYRQKMYELSLPSYEQIGWYDGVKLAYRDIAHPEFLLVIVWKSHVDEAEF